MKRHFLTAMPVIITISMLSFALPASAQRVSRAAARAAEIRAENARAAALAAEIEARHYTAEELRVMAETARATKDADGLAFALKRLAAIETRRFDIRLELGEALIALNKLPEAIDILNEASAIIPSDEAPHRLLAKIYSAQGIDSLRATHLVQAALLAQRNWENQFNLAAYYISKGNVKEAEKLLEKSMAINNAFAPAKFEYGKILLGRNDLERAFRAFDEAVLLEPQNARYLAYYAYAASVTNRAVTAKERIEAALAIAPNNPEILTLAAKVRLAGGNVAAAGQHARTAVRQAPADMRALETLGDIFAASFQYKEATGTYMTVWEKAGYREELARKLGVVLILDEKYREAKPFFDAIAVKKPNDGEILYRLTEINCELGDIKQANGLLMLNRFGGDEANLVWHKICQGRIHEAQNDADLAKIDYSAALLLDDRNAHANAAMGRLLLRQAKLDSAMFYYETAAKLDPANIRNFIAMAKIHEASQRRAEAVAIYESIIASNPKNRDLYMLIANIYEEQGNAAAAIKTLNKGLLYSSKDANIHFKLGKLYMDTKQYEKSIEAYSASIGRGKVGAQNVEALRLIGNIYYTKLMNEKKALEYFKKYVKAGGKDSSVDLFIKRMSGKKGS